MDSRLSIEESLKLLAPGKVSPTSKKNKSHRSPVRIPTVSPVKTKKINQIEVIEKFPSIYDKKEESDGEDEDEENIAEEVEIKKDIVPHTPTRIKIESPKTPVRKFSNLSKEVSNYTLFNKLREYRYTCLKYILNEKDNNFMYAVCYNPNGEEVFIDIEESQESISAPDSDIIIVKYNIDPIVLDSYQGDLTQKMPTGTSGIVFYEGPSYLFCDKKDDGSLNIRRFNIFDNIDRKQLATSYTYEIVKLNDLLKNPNLILEITKDTYQIAHQQQISIVKNTSDNMTTSLNNLVKATEKFNSVYYSYTKHLVDDLTTLGSFASKYYYKYGEGKLTDIEAEAFDRVSVNMFMRFQIFNEQLITANYINNLIPEIDKCIKTVTNLTEGMEINDLKYSGRLLEMDQADIFL
jgi:hypothetical protein